MTDLFPTPEDKRRMAESIGSFDPRAAVDWYATAYLQQYGGKDEYEAALKAWKAAKPKPEQFVPAGYREAVEAFQARVEAKAKAEFDSIWGDLLNRGATPD
jgi:hypothetical protein